MCYVQKEGGDNGLDVEGKGHLDPKSMEGV